MKTVGNVRFWRSAEGWGVIDSVETPGGCWAHFTHIDTDPTKFRELSAGQEVRFDWEQYPQDGYDYRVIAVTPHWTTTES